MDTEKLLQIYASLTAQLDSLKTQAEADSIYYRGAIDGMRKLVDEYQKSTDEEEVSESSEPVPLKKRAKKGTIQ